MGIRTFEQTMQHPFRLAPAERGYAVVAFQSAKHGVISGIAESSSRESDILSPGGSS